MGKFKVGDKVRIRESSEELIITDLFTKTVTYYNEEDIEEYAVLENDSKTKKYTIIIDNIYLTDMSPEKMKRRFFGDVIKFEIQTEIKEYENITADKVLEVKYDNKTDKLYLTTEKLSTIEL